jgi:hypothetical protein
LLLGDRIDRAIEKFCADTSPAGKDVPSAVELWLELIRAEIAREPGLLPYSDDVARHEAAIAALALSKEAQCDAQIAAERSGPLPVADPHGFEPVPRIGRHVRVNGYGFDVPAIVTAIEECDRLEPVDSPTACTVLLVKSPDRPRPIAHSISEGFRLLLALCDGRRSSAAIVQTLTAELGGANEDNIAREALDALEALRVRNVLIYDIRPTRQGGEDDPENVVPR